MLIYGWRENKIALLPVENHRCNNCNSEKSLFIQVNKMYVHLFWIPFIPLAKKTYSVCTHCKQSLKSNEMPPDLQKKSYQIKKNTKTPWWYFIGCILIGCILLFIASSLLLHI